MARKPLVSNAGDPKQVKEAARVEKSRAERFGLDLKGTLETMPGRALLWALIGRARVYGSVFHRDAGVMAYNAGRQDFGHELMAEIISTDPALYLTMEREARDRDTRDRAEEEALTTPRADTGGDADVS